MDVYGDTDLGRQALAIGIWENEGGAPAPTIINHQYGRRIETDRTWTIYHVFSGIPARVDGSRTTGLTRAEATNGLVLLSHRNVRRKKAAALPSSPAHPPGPAGCRVTKPMIRRLL